MASAGSTEAAGRLGPSSGKGDLAAQGVEYLVPAWVRVRRERFGLLFYDTRSARLTFVRSGESLLPPPFVGERRVLRVKTRGPEEEAAVSSLLEKLVARGLVVVSPTA